MKVTKQETLYNEDYVATLKHKCLKKDSSIPPFYLFIFFGPFFGLFWDNALLNDDHHTLIYLQLNDCNSILEQGMTLYECLWRYTGICTESRVTCMKENYERWLCHEYYVNYMIMLSNMTMMNVSCI